MKATTVKEILVATKWILEHSGWCQGASGKDESGWTTSASNPSCVSRCLTGALSIVEADGVLRNQAYQLLTDQAWFDHRLGAITFNDTPGRTKQDVLNLLDKVIARAT